MSGLSWLVREGTPRNAISYIAAYELDASFLFQGFPASAPDGRETRSPPALMSSRCFLYVCSISRRHLVYVIIVKHEVQEYVPPGTLCFRCTSTAHAGVFI